jgi:hypothetical protein
MTIELIGVIALTLGIVGLFLPTSFLVYVFLCFTLLGAAAAFVLEAVGGTNIMPAHLLLGFLAIRLLNNSDIMRASVRGLTFPLPGFWLASTILYSLVTAYFMPRLFEGQTFTFAVRSQSGFVMLLEPAMSNITQSIYFFADFVCFFVFYGYAGSFVARRLLGNAVLVCATLNLVFAALDLITYFTNTTELFSFIRNANYALLNDTEIAGFKRIVGSFVEASSFGAVTLGYFAFTLRLWLLGIRTRLTSTLTVISLIALVFSTSTTAYVGLVAFLLLAYFQIVLRAMRGMMSPNMTLFAVGLPILCLVMGISIALNDASAAYFQNLLDTTILNKMSTDSGIERSSWNAQAMQNFYDTLGFGVGNGSLRASSFPILVLASLGVLGSVLFGLFFVAFLIPNKRAEQFESTDSAYRQAAKSACTALLITATVSGALIDLGLLFYALAALACAEPSGDGTRSLQNRPAPQV